MYLQSFIYMVVPVMKVSCKYHMHAVLYKYLEKKDGKIYKAAGYKLWKKLVYSSKSLAQNSKRRQGPINWPLKLKSWPKVRRTSNCLCKFSPKLAFVIPYKYGNSLLPPLPPLNVVLVTVLLFMISSY